MQKILFGVLSALIIITLCELRYGHGGMLDNKKIKLQIHKQMIINQGLKNRNDLESFKIAGIKGSRVELEARARYELNLIKPNEILVILPNNYILKKNKQLNVKGHN